MAGTALATPGQKLKNTHSRCGIEFGVWVSGLFKKMFRLGSVSGVFGILEDFGLLEREVEGVCGCSRVQGCANISGSLRIYTP